MTTRTLIDEAIVRAKMNGVGNPREAHVDHDTYRKLVNECNEMLSSSGEGWVGRMLGATVCYNGVAVIPTDWDGFLLRIT